MEWKIIEGYSKCNEGDVCINEEATCEHCGKLAPFTPIFCNGCTYYCYWCTITEETIPDELWEEIQTISLGKQLAYYKNKVTETEEKLKCMLMKQMKKLKD